MSIRVGKIRASAADLKCDTGSSQGSGAEMPAGFAHVPGENLKRHPEKKQERVFKVSYLHVPKKEVN